MLKFCIDAGHNNSAYDTGATGNGMNEQDVTFDIANSLKELLIQHGFGVLMTRAKKSDNVGMNAKDSINKRAQMANASNCDYFISIHCNSHTNKGATGTETLIYGLGGQAEKLATRVNKRIVSALGTYNRGVKVRTDLGVLRLTNMPAILVETAFISNSSDATLLKNKREVFARAIFDGICEHIGKKNDSLNEIDDIVAYLFENEVLSDVEKWKKKCKEDQNVYWLCYKMANRLRREN